MKILTLLLSSLILSVIAYFNSPEPAPEPAKTVCCHIAKDKEDATMAFASLANDPDFIKEHQNPLAIDYQTVAGKTIKFKGSDGVEASALLFKAKKKSSNYLFVIHEWYGLNDHIKQEAEKFYNDLQAKNVNVIALDLYDGKVAANRDDAAKYMQGMKPERGVAIIKGLLNYVGKNAKIATVGWCLGGGWSLQSSLIAENQSVACIIYYGMPEKDKEKLKKLNAEVLGIFAGQEKWINTDIVNQFDADLNELGKKHTIKSFEAEHGFANPSNPIFNKGYAEEAYLMSLNFLKSKF